MAPSQGRNFALPDYEEDDAGSLAGSWGRSPPPKRAWRFPERNVCGKAIECESERYRPKHIEVF